MKYFDYESVAREAGIPEERLAEWREVFERQYHGNQMLVELRMLRTCMAASRSPEALDAIIKELETERNAER